MDRKTHAILIVAAVLALGSICSADPINGSLTLTGLDVTQNGSDLSTSTQISSTDAINDFGFFDYSVIPDLTSFGPTILDTTNLDAFTLTNATYGSFAGVTKGNIVDQTANFLEVDLTGTFTPGPGLGVGLVPTTSGLQIEVNLSGSSLTETMTLTSPNGASSVPEPASLALLGSLLAILSFSRRKPANCR